MVSKDIIRHELIGTFVRIENHKNKSLVGLIGKIIDETKNSIIILTANKERKEVLKEGAEFILDIKSGEKIERLRILGNVIIARPEDRIKMKI